MIEFYLTKIVFITLLLVLGFFIFKGLNQIAKSGTYTYKQLVILIILGVLAVGCGWMV